MITIGSYTSRNAVSRAFRIKLIDPRLPRQELRLMFQYDAEGLLLIVSQSHGVRQVFFPAHEVGQDIVAFLAGKCPDSIAARCQSSIDNLEIDLPIFFWNVEDNLCRMRSRGVLSNDACADAFETLEHYRAELNAEALQSFLHLENLSDVVEASLAYKATDEELVFWRVVWKAVVAKARVLEQELATA